MDRVTYNTALSLSEIRIDEAMWGPGSYEPVMRWLMNEYDPATMPVLVASTIVGREGTYLLGWKHEGTEFPPLLPMIFGPGYAVHQLDQFDAERKMIARMEDDEHGEYGIGSPDGKE